MDQAEPGAVIDPVLVELMLGPQTALIAGFVVFVLAITKWLEGRIWADVGLGPTAILTKMLGPVLAVVTSFVASLALGVRVDPATVLLTSGLAVLSFDQGQGLKKWWPVVSRLVQAYRTIPPVEVPQGEEP